MNVADLMLGEFAKAIKAKPTLHLGLYHSLLDWYHPLYMQDKASGWKTNTYPQVGKYRWKYNFFGRLFIITLQILFAVCSIVHFIFSN